MCTEIGIGVQFTDYCPGGDDHKQWTTEERKLYVLRTDITQLSSYYDTMKDENKQLKVNDDDKQTDKVEQLRTKVAW